MAAQVGIDIVGADPDKWLARRHVAVDPGNILKGIIDVTINDLPACYPSSAVLLRHWLSKSFTSLLLMAMILMLSKLNGLFK